MCCVEIESEVIDIIWLRSNMVNSNAVRHKYFIIPLQSVVNANGVFSLTTPTFSNHPIDDNDRGQIILYSGASRQHQTGRRNTMHQRQRRQNRANVGFP